MVLEFVSVLCVTTCGLATVLFEPGLVSSTPRPVSAATIPTLSLSRSPGSIARL